MDGITSSILGSSVVSGSRPTGGRQARKRPENEPRKVERTYPDHML